MIRCRRCDQPIMPDQWRFGSPETGWEHTPGDCHDETATLEVTHVKGEPGEVRTIETTEAVIIKPISNRQPNDVILLEDATERGWTWTLTMTPEGVKGAISRGNQYFTADGTLRQVVDVLALYAIEQDTDQ